MEICQRMKITRQKNPNKKHLTVKGKYLTSLCTVGSVHSLPIRRLASKTVFSGLEVNWFLAASPISLSPSAVKATYEGVIRLPWSLAMISTRPFLKTPTLELLCFVLVRF